MKLRNRVKELRRVPAGELIHNPKNWRKHPEKQREALSGLFREIGIVDAILARETPAGLMIIDGHLRAETLDPDHPVPVLILDVTADEADALLMALDSTTGMATADADLYDGLLRDIQTSDSAIADLLADTASGMGVIPAQDVMDQPEFTEEIADEVEYVQCPKCGKQQPA